MTENTSFSRQNTRYFDINSCQISIVLYYIHELIPPQTDSKHPLYHTENKPQRKKLHHFEKIITKIFGRLRKKHYLCIANEKRHVPPVERQSKRHSLKRTSTVW